jgi:hypothetical protein
MATGGQGAAPSAGTSLAWSSPVTFVVTWFMRTTCAGAQPERQGRPAGAQVPSRRPGLQQLPLSSVQHLPRGNMAVDDCHLRFSFRRDFQSRYMYSVVR